MKRLSRGPLVNPPSRSGHAVIKLAATVVLMFLLIGGIYYLLMQISGAVRCGEQLRRIFQALELYEMTHGALPRLAFFPDEPMTDADSLRVVLEAYGLDSEVWICPSSHPAIAQTGMSYVWNTRLNGRNLRDLAERQWMLVEINALSPDVPTPHLGYYNVLYTDGKVERIRDPLSKLRGL
ncbi:MAG TPA: hypothetical protein PKE26_14240 [Kiritimatiellia bacterium]|nr:hypothetical protein [Kiritimatiellia bacterium]HMP00260.1 hypothetical protein [Kiritimatiellia bacterium]HMP97512.1 hypothetical protein [Kiritimatiellia bacterium]